MECFVVVAVLWISSSGLPDPNFPALRASSSPVRTRLTTERRGPGLGNIQGLHAVAYLGRLYNHFVIEVKSFTFVRIIFPVFYSSYMMAEFV
jgi:hypothetical protein